MSDFCFWEFRRGKGCSTCGLRILAVNFQFLQTFSADEVTANTQVFQHEVNQTR